MISQSEVLHACSGLCVIDDNAAGPCGKQRFFFGHSNRVTCIAYNSLKGMAASGQIDPKGSDLPFVAVWRTSDCVMLSALVFHERSVNCLGFNADGKILVTMGNEDNHNIAIWNEFHTPGSECAKG